MSTREDNIYYARLAEQGERYEDMIKYMKIVCKVTIWILIINHVFDRVDKNFQMKKEIYWVSHIRMRLVLEELHGELSLLSRTKKSIRYNKSNFH